MASWLGGRSSIPRACLTGCSVAPALQRSLESRGLWMGHAEALGSLFTISMVPEISRAFEVLTALSGIPTTQTRQRGRSELLPRFAKGDGPRQHGGQACREGM